MDKSEFAGTVERKGLVSFKGKPMILIRARAESW